MKNKFTGVKKLNLLVIPSAYPAHDNDISGIFVLDYLASVHKHCNITVLRATIGEKGKRVERGVTHGFETINYRSAGFFNLPMKKYLRYADMIFNTGTLKKEIEKGKFDIIHVHGATMHGFLAKRLARAFNIPYTITVHTGPFSKIAESPLMFRVAKNVVEGSSCLMTVSKDLESQILATGITPKDKIVTYNPVNTDLFRIGPESELKNEFIFVGRFEDYKGALRIVKAFSSIANELPNWKLRLIGGGPEQENIEKFVQANELENRVLVYGQMTKSEISDYLRQAKIFVFPSEHETFGIVIAEAMACGVPVLVGNRTAPPEFVEKDQGILVNPQNIAELRDSMLRMVKSINEYSRTSIRSKVVERFGFEKFGDKLVQHYLNIVSKK